MATVVKPARWMVTHDRFRQGDTDKTSVRETGTECAGNELLYSLFTFSNLRHEMRTQHSVGFVCCVVVRA